MKRYLPFVIIAVVLLVVVGVAISFYRSAHRVASAGAMASGAPGAEPPHTRGTRGAPVTIEEFGDFQCPPCGALYPELKKIEAEDGPQVFVIFREWPLTKIHQNALLAAHTAEAAGLQNHFWEMHDLLYQNQSAWSGAKDARPIFISYARGIGLDADRFTRDIDGNEADARIVADHQRGQSLGVQATPTVFINGQELSAEMTSPQGLRMAVNKILGK